MNYVIAPPAPACVPRSIIQLIIFDARNITIRPITAWIRVVFPFFTFSSSPPAVNI
jgi:hypothetical protein